MSTKVKTVLIEFTEAELETIAAAMDDYMSYADDEFANEDDLIGGIPVADRVNSITVSYTHLTLPTKRIV